MKPHLVLGLLVVLLGGLIAGSATDRAVQPSAAMGSVRRIAEKGSHTGTAPTFPQYLVHYQPECVVFCPTGALAFGEADAALVEQQKDMAKQLRYPQTSSLVR